MRQNNLTRADFDRLQQSYSRNYFELYKKFYVVRCKLEKVQAKLETMFANGDEGATLDDLIEIYDVIMEGAENYEAKGK